LQVQDMTVDEFTCWLGYIEELNKRMEDGQSR